MEKDNNELYGKMTETEKGGNAFNFENTVFDFRNLAAETCFECSNEKFAKELIKSRKFSQVVDVRASTVMHTKN